MWLHTSVQDWKWKYIAKERKVDLWTFLVKTEVKLSYGLEYVIG